MGVIGWLVEIVVFLWIVVVFYVYVVVLQVGDYCFGLFWYYYCVEFVLEEYYWCVDMFDLKYWVVYQVVMVLVQWVVNQLVEVVIFEFVGVMCQC